MCIINTRKLQINGLKMLEQRTHKLKTWANLAVEYAHVNKEKDEKELKRREEREQRILARAEAEAKLRVFREEFNEEFEAFIKYDNMKRAEMANARGQQC